MSRSGQVADVFTAIADPTRRALLLRLAREGERNVKQLMEPFAMSQPAVSKHLKVLRDAGLVRSRRSGREQIYDIEARRLRDVQDWISQFEKYWDDKLDALGEYLDRNKRGKATKRKKGQP